MRRLTANLVWADTPGNVLLPAQTTWLPRDAGANVSQVSIVERTPVAGYGPACRAAVLPVGPHSIAYLR